MVPTPTTADEDEEADDEPDEDIDEVEPQDAADSSLADPFDGEEDPDEVDVDLADVDVGEPIEEDSPFDGTEDVDEGTEYGGESDFSGGPEGDFGDMSPGDMMDQAEEPLDEIINDGAARLAVVGVPQQFRQGNETRTKQSLEDEFREVFEEFRLGHYGAQVAHEYLFVDKEVDPIWGFAASATMCTALVLWMRPDGDEIVDTVQHQITNIRGGDEPTVDQPAAQTEADT